MDSQEFLPVVPPISGICVAKHANGAPTRIVKCETCPSVTVVQKALLRFSWQSSCECNLLKHPTTIIQTGSLIGEGSPAESSGLREECRHASRDGEFVVV